MANRVTDCITYCNGQLGPVLAMPLVLDVDASGSLRTIEVTAFLAKIDGTLVNRNILGCYCCPLGLQREIHLNSICTRTLCDYVV